MNGMEMSWAAAVVAMVKSVAMAAVLVVTIVRLSRGGNGSSPRRHGAAEIHGQPGMWSRTERKTERSTPVGQDAVHEF
jgi:hypothetical protein